MSLVGYARVSTAERRQMLDRQLDTIITASRSRTVHDQAYRHTPSLTDRATVLAESASSATDV